MLAHGQNRGTRWSERKWGLNGETPIAGKWQDWVFWEGIPSEKYITCKQSDKTEGTKYAR